MTDDSQELRRSLWGRARELDLFVWVALLVILAGLVARFWGLGFPARFSFDEHHFVENARNYLAGKADWNDHPPLGKLLIAFWMYLWGDHSWTWRLASALCGAGTVGVAMALGRSLFPHKRDVALLAGALVAMDGFCLVYSRTALLDGQLSFFALLSVLAASVSRSWWSWLCVGLLVGLTTGIKFSGVCTLLPIAFLLVTRERPRAWFLRGVLLALGFSLAYVGQWVLGLWLSGQYESPTQALTQTVHLYKHHAAFTKMENAATSSWTSWWLPENPIKLYQIKAGRAVRVATSLGNPLLWWSVWLSAGATVTSLLWFGLRSALDSAVSGLSSTWGNIWREQGRAFLVLCLGWLGFLAPWILSRRDSYIYHYLPAYTFGLILLAALIAHCAPLLHRRVKLGFLIVAFAVSSFYAPVWLGMTLSKTAVAQRLFVSGWR